MVETTPITREFMLSRCTIARASFLLLLLPFFSSSSFTFGSSKEGWYYRCIGLDPWTIHQTLFPFFFFNCPLRFWFFGIGEICYKRMLLYNKNKKSQKSKTTINRFLVSINVLGSAGPIRFVVKEDETVANVIDYALKCYAREGRLPLLGSDSSFFLLYCPYFASEGQSLIVSDSLTCFTMNWTLNGFAVLCTFWLIITAFNPWGKIGSTGSRNFVLSKKLESQNLEDSVVTTTIRKTSGRWKTWLNKSLGLMVPSH